ncbi:MAG: hypothetical protein IJ688_03100 [Treponema sp.]|nr:hypothetical protein [Treponema sp.]
MISFHGSKTGLVGASIFMVSLMSVFSSILSLKKTNIRLKEKQVQLLSEKIEKSNEAAIRMAEDEVL